MQRGIKIKLDAVIFDDGLLIGLDTHDQLGRHLEGHVKAKQDLFRQILDSLDRGDSIEEVFTLPKEPPHLQGPGDFIGMFRSEALTTANNLRKRYGNEKIRDVMQRAILKEPFVIHRK